MKTGRQADISTILGCAFLLSLSMSSADAQGQQEAAAAPALRAASEDRVVPLTSRFVLNDTPLHYGLDSVVSVGSIGGSRRDLFPQLDATFTLSSKLHESVDSGLYRRKQTGWYGQLKTTTSERIITTVRREAVNLRGTSTQLTITGKCLFAEEGVTDTYCTYTPGTVTTPEDIDLDTLVPTRFTLDSDFGQEISQETHDALKAEGFQRGIEGSDEQVGLDIDLPNAGYSFSERRGALNDISRYENIETRPVLSFSRVEQNLYSNDEQAALDRTIRGLVLLDSDEWTREAAALQAIGWLLPGFDGSLAAGSGHPNLAIGNNLFFAANNNRLPEESYTVFQSGGAWVAHPKTAPRSAAETPVAWANALWLGFSPVREIDQETRLEFVTSGSREVITSDFTQTGTGTNIDEIIDGRITVIDDLVGDLTQIDITSIDDLFVQTGTQVTSQEAIRKVTQRETSDYRLVPHLSFTGNRTSGTDVVRYYTGVIVDGDANAYAGLDYSVNAESGWSASFGAIFYTDPDRDYFSGLQAQIGKDVELTEDSDLSFGLAGSVELDRPDVDGTELLPGEGANLLDLVGRYRHEDVSYTVRQRFSDIGNDEDALSSTLGLIYQFNPEVALSVEVTPYSTEDAYIRTRAGLSWTFEEAPGAPTLRVQWAEINYDYGDDNVGRSLETSEQTVLAGLQMTF